MVDWLVVVVGVAGECEFVSGFSKCRFRDLCPHSFVMAKGTDWSRCVVGKSANTVHGQYHTGFWQRDSEVGPMTELDA